MPDRSFAAEPVVALIGTAFPDDAFAGNVIYDGGGPFWRPVLERI